MEKRKPIRPIARLPADPSGNDEYCSICSDDTVVLVIGGRANCHYCGNQVNLCSSCCAVMKREMGDTLYTFGERSYEGEWPDTPENSSEKED